MALKPFEQVYPGQNAPNLQPKKGKEIAPREWERRQRMKEYRIAARREKRNRKSDEKKQRALNATILRRMTRNPAKYNKNAGRNRLRAIELERRRIHTNAVNMAQRLAAVYDASGALFNVKPVTTLEDGRVVTLEAIERKKEREAEKARLEAEGQQNDSGPGESHPHSASDILNPDRMVMIVESKMPKKHDPSGGLSKTQLKKQELFAPRPPPSKPVIPEGIDPPSDEEEDWLDLWSLPDEELERRVLREKRRKASERRELRVKQKSFKAERRAARDEKRRVYREMKQIWKVLREEERRRRKFLVKMEDEESKRLATEVTTMHRRQAMEICAELGFTLENVEGVNEIVPKALGMKGREVDFEKLEVVGDAPSGLKVKDDAGEEKQAKRKSNRVDLGKIADEAFTHSIYDNNFAQVNDQDMTGNANFVQLDSGKHGQEYEALSYNHKLRRKLRRAIESATIKKELLVRAAAIKYCEEHLIPVPAVLHTPTKPENVRGARTMPDGQLETAKQERVRARVELAEFNTMAKVLRNQAKEMAVEAGIRIYLELTDRIPKREGFDELIERRARAKTVPEGRQREFEGMGDMSFGETLSAADDEGDEEAGAAVGGIWPAMSMEQLLSSWPMPKDTADEDGDVAMADAAAAADDERGQAPSSSSEDSAARQIKREAGMASSNKKAAPARKSGSTSDSSGGDSSSASEDDDGTFDTDMSD